MKPPLSHLKKHCDKSLRTEIISDKDMEFDVIGVSLDTDETELREYLEVCNIPWRQIFSGEGWQSPLVKQYGIRGVPSAWLIDREGKLISYEARGTTLWQLVAEAMKGESAFTHSVL